MLHATKSETQPSDGGRAHGRREARRTGVGELLLDALISWIVLAIIACGIQWTWQYWGQNLDALSVSRRIERAQGWDPDAVAAADGVGQRIAQPRYSDPPLEAAPSYAGVIGHMYIPRFGSDWDRMIQEGTGQDVLDNLGVGHYEQSMMPGSLGVAAFAGHRQPASLWLQDTVKPGDAVVIRTRDYWYVYRIQGTRIVTADDWSVLDPVEGQRTLVLTTCDPKWETRQPANRLVATARFDYWARVADGTVRELTGPKTETKGVQPVISRVSVSVSTVTHDAPVSPVLALACLLPWLLIDAGCWLFDRRRSRDRLICGGWWNPMTLAWRIQAGPLPLRMVLYTLMWMGVVFACYAWACPWVAENVPWFATPHPTMG